jgi:hypothetical protein
MKSRMNIILVAVLVMLCAITAMLIRGQRTTVVTAAAPLGAASSPFLRIQVQTLPPAVSATREPVAAPTLALPAPQVNPVKAVKSSGAGEAGYTAADGDTLSNVAAGLLGSDTKKNRDAVIAGNPSLAADPDRVLAGKKYFLEAPTANTPAATASEVPTASIPATQPAVSEAAHADSDRVLNYTARSGDTVSVLAAGLLGGDSKTNRDAIIGENESLQRNPNRVVAGKTYKIPTTTGLSAAPVSAPVPHVAATTQPEADEVVQNGAGRALRYTARAGDNVSKLATVLLGSDTQANRDAIISNNASLKNDPDRVVAGQTYWIPAPAAPTEKR